MISKQILRNIFLLQIAFYAISSKAMVESTTSFEDLKNVMVYIEKQKEIRQNSLASYSPAATRKSAKNWASKSPQVAIVQERLPSNYMSVDAQPMFDLPVTYNHKVKKWINYFQTSGKKWFGTWLSRSHRYLPFMTETLRQKNLPQDLAFVAMIESGFSGKAVSSAQAVGYWQFIQPTANRYGLRTNWWLDERRDYTKSTEAACRYLDDLYKIFGSWYLTAAGYNMGETRLKRLVAKYRTKNFWILAEKPDFPKETREYIPKLIAAMMISKAPGLYGFRGIEALPPHRYDYFHIPGGTDLHNLANYLKINKEDMLKLNPELVKGFVPSFVSQHKIRIPKGLARKVSQFVRLQIN